MSTEMTTNESQIQGLTLPSDTPVAPVTTAAEKPQSKVPLCQNCSFELDGSFCGRCGQPEQSMIRFFGSVILHFLDDIFGFDSRAGRTLLPLVFRPGFLTNEYIRGRRVHYVPPVRLYFFVSIIFFLMLGFFTDDSVSELAKLQQDNNQNISSISKKITSLQTKMTAEDYVLVNNDQTRLDELLEKRVDAQASLQESIDKIQAKIDKIELRESQPDYVPKPADGIRKQAFIGSIKVMELNLSEHPYADRLISLDHRLAKLEAKKSQPGYQPSTKDDKKALKLQERRAELLIDAQEEKSEEEERGNDKESGDNVVNFNSGSIADFDFLSAAENQRLKVFIDELEQKAKKAFEQDATPLVQQILGVLPQMMFILLPIFAFILKIYYLFAKRFYMEHLTVALHSHAFIFVVLMLMALLSTLHDNIVSDYETMGAIIDNIVIGLAIWVPCYLYMMQKRVYKQGYFFTFIKFVMVGITYLFLIGFATAVAFFWGLAKL